MAFANHKIPYVFPFIPLLLKERIEVELLEIFKIDVTSAVIVPVLVIVIPLSVDWIIEPAPCTMLPPDQVNAHTEDIKVLFVPVFKVPPSTLNVLEQVKSPVKVYVPEAQFIPTVPL